LFQDGATALFAQPGIETIAVTDSVAIESLGLPDEDLTRVKIIDMADSFAQCIRNMGD
jgi:phosphoribosylpyrophosphate synthetase